MEIGSKELNPVRVGDGAGESVKNITWIHMKIRNSLQVKQLPDNVLKDLEKLSLRIWKNFKIEQLSKIKFYKSILLPICQYILNRCFSRYADSSPRTIPRLTLPRWTFPRTDNSPNGQFPDRTLPRLDISPLRHFPERTFPRPDISPTGHFPDHMF